MAVEVNSEYLKPRTDRYVLVTILTTMILLIGSVSVFVVCDGHFGFTSEFKGLPVQKYTPEKYSDSTPASNKS